MKTNVLKTFKEFFEKPHVIIIENKVFKKSHNLSLANYCYYKF